MFASKKRVKETPWGVADDCQKIAEGIERVSTPGHGGYLLSPARWLQFRSIFLSFNPFAGPMAFEEDSDWAMVAAAFPEYFSDEQIYGASATIAVNCKPFRATDSHRQWLEVATILDSTPHGQAFKDRAARFYETIKNCWQVSGCGCGQGKGWGVFLRHVSNDTTKTIRMADYPAKRFYTDADIAALESVTV